MHRGDASMQTHLRPVSLGRGAPRDLSLSLFVGGTTTTKLGSDIIDQAGKDVLAGYRTTFDDDLGRPRPVHDCASTIFKHRLCSIIIHGWNYAWFWFHDWFLERVERKDTIYFRPSFEWDSNDKAKVREERKWYVSRYFELDNFFLFELFI